MSRWTADSDRDYADQPWARRDACATPGCEQAPIATSIYCAACRQAQADRAHHVHETLKPRKSA